MHKWGLRTRVLLLTLVPTLTIALILGFFFVQVRLTELDDSLANRGDTILQKFYPTIQSQTLQQQQLKAQGDKSAVEQQREQIQKLVNRLLEETDVRAATLLNAGGLSLAHAGPTMRPLPQPHAQYLQTPKSKELQTESSMRFIRPIFSSDPLGLDLVPGSYSGELIGWIELELSTVNTTLKKYQLFLASGAVIFLGILINGILALRMSREITDPISQIIQAINRIKEGDLDTRVHTGASGEIHQLESGINAMAESLKAGHEELQQSVEQATEDLRETLETIEIQNIELDLARKEALEASRIKSEFLANMSHEIRTPLNGIIGFTNLLFKTKLDSRQQDYLDTILKSSEGLLAIINDVLDFSKIEAGKLVLDHIPLNLREVMEDVLTMLAPLAHEKNLELVSLIYSDVPLHLVGDPLRLKQIATNLVNNGIKFTESGNIILRVMLEKAQDNQAVLKISITDTGIGLSGADQKAIFQAFNQADTSTARRFGGTGLGLVISKHLVEQMGGEMGLESEAGKGSTFWFTLRADLNSRADLNTDANLFRGYRCALFDANPIARLSTRHLLEHWSLDVEEVEIFEELLGHVELMNQQGQGYDLVIIGLPPTLLIEELPQTLERIKRAGSKPVVLASTTENVAHQQLLENHAAGHLAKPLCYEKLKAVVADVLMGQNQHTLDFDHSLEAQTLTQSNRAPKILAVDDNLANLKLVCALLEDLGVEVTSADNGAQALDIMEGQAFDLVLMDIQMPVMDGVETTKAIRRKESNRRRTPIVALTAHAMANEKQQLLRSGMDDYVTKPINERQLKHIIQKWTGFQVQTEVEPPPAAAPATSGDSDLVNMKEGLRLANGKQDLAMDMLNMLLDSLDNEKKAIQEAAQARDHNQLLETVHKLHGATRYCGVPLLRQAANQLETLLKKGETDQYEEATKDLLWRIEQLLDWRIRNKEPRMQSS